MLSKEATRTERIWEKDSNANLPPLLPQEDTTARLLRRNARHYPNHPALRKKRYGIWNKYTWQDYYQAVKEVALGLLSSGIQAQQTVAIIGDNDPEWWFAAMAANALRCIEYGIFVDCGLAEVEYFVGTGDAVYVFAKDQEQVDKLLALRDKLPKVRKVIYWEAKGMWAYDDPWLMPFTALRELGHEYEKEHPNAFEESVDAGQSDDICCLSYTSGTTRFPKPAMHSHRAQIIRAAHLYKYSDWREGDDYFSFVCPAWGVDQLFGIVCALKYRWVVNFPEGPQTIRIDAREIGAPFQFGGARNFEEMAREVRVRLADADFLKRAFYNLFLPVGLRIADHTYANTKPSVGLRALNLIADWLVFRPLRDQLGYGKPRTLIISGSMLSPDLCRYFHAMGFPITVTYGSTETASVSTEHCRGRRMGSAGKLLPERTVKLTAEGELAVKLDEHCFSGYYNRPDASREAMPGDGWYYTGDAVYIDDDGYVFFLDRIQELQVLSSGAKFSATYVESKLRFSPYIKDVAILGNGRDFVALLVNIDLTNVSKWAEKRHLVYTTFVDLSQKKDVLDLIEGEIAHVNRTLPEHARVKRFVNMHKELDPDEAELTRTRKLKREVIAQKYAPLVEALYSGASGVDVSTEVKYRDGRTGTISARVQVRDVRANSW